MNSLTDIEISGLGIHEKVGQVVMPRLDFNDTDTLTLAKTLVRDFGVGGFIVFGGTKTLVTEATEELQSISEVPLIFACDAERGAGQILSDMTLFPFTMSLGAIGDERLVYEEATYIAKEMIECGFNLIFAPVLDVNTNPDNPIINIRAYGDDPGLVSRMAGAFISGCQENGLPACGKHFPGHGGAGLDSHLELPVIETGLEDLADCELIPFRDAVDKGVASLMTAHLALPRIAREALPVTISPEIIDGVLRNGLGFEGVVFTDSFHMSGISKVGDEDDLSHLSLKAGCDVILDPKDPYRLLSRLNDMAATGELSEEILNISSDRVLSLKKRWLGDSTAAASPSAVEAEELIERIARGSVCLLKGGKLNSNKANVYIFDVTNSNADISKTFTDRLLDARIEVKSVQVSLTSPADFDPKGTDAGKAAICLIYTSVGAWKKQSKVPEYYKTILRELGNLPAETILVSFGSPYVIRDFGNFDAVICAFDSLDECQTAAAEVVLGKLTATGSLPVRL
jgi:beta-N-acetylhexosaminidase